MTLSLQRPLRLAAAAALVLAAAGAQAQTTVQDAWIRGTVPQQKATGLFARITSVQGGRLVAVSTPAAGLVEIHQMAMDGNVMRMRAIDALELPPGRTVPLAPGGHHVMLMELKQPLADGSSVPVQFVVETGGRRETVRIDVPVRGPGAAPAAADGHGAHKH